MKNYFELKPTIGLGDFNFGTDISVIMKELGEPDEIEVVEEEDYETQIITYWEKGLTFFCEGDNNSTFICVEADNEELSLFGEKIIGKDERSIIELMKKNNYNEFDTEEEEWGEKRLTYEDLLLDFYFEEDELVSASWTTPDDF